MTVTKSQSLALRLAVPTPIESVVYVFVCTLFLVITSFSSVLDAFVFESQRQDVRSFGAIVSSRIETFLGVLDGQKLSATVITLLFWAAAGAVLYMLVWVLGSWLGDLKSGAQENSRSFVHAQGYNRQDAWHQVLARFLFRFFAGITLLAYAVVFFNLLLPLWGHFFKVGVGSLSSISGWFMVALAVGMAAASLHGYTVLLRLIAMKSRLFGQAEMVE